jgi:GntR family transcriptional regulator, transcriptional repressor for pyruvate dehydrogenase complex
VNQTKAHPIPQLRPSSTADWVANILRERILSAEEGVYLGSEGELAEKIGISLPTLRQAARMLEYEELLKVKPGKGGGYFTRRPSIETAIRSASQYLSSKDLISNPMFMDAADTLIAKILGQAVKCSNKELRVELRQFIENQHKNSEQLLPPEESFKYSAILMNLFGRMSENILLELFSGILWNEVSVSRTSSTFQGSEEIVKTNYRTRLEVAEAVFELDEEKALKAWQKRSKFLRSWPQRGLRINSQRLIA